MTAPDRELGPIIEALQAPPGTAWRRATFSAPEGGDGWERVTADPVRLKQGPAVKLVITGATEHPMTRTVPAADWGGALAEILAAGPRNLHVTTPAGEWHARRGKRRWLVSLGRPSRPAPAPGSESLGRHDRARRHLLDPTDPAVLTLFQETGLVGKSGQVRGESAGKYRQVQHFLELLRPLAVLDASESRPLRIVDAGCGSAHLGLALYLFAVRLGREPVLTGIDRNEVLVERVAGMAARLRYPRTRFLASPVGEIEHGDLGEIDLLVSLHLCDTATDDALLAGVRSGARAIVLAPCCQHELIPQLEPARLVGAAATLARHGAMRERLASLLTDEFRALALEAVGYRVDVLDFTGPENTGKSLMLRAERRGRGLPAARRTEARANFARLAEHWGVSPACSRVLDEIDG